MTIRDPRLKAGDLYPLANERWRWPSSHRIQATGDFRAPRKGEWYLSGAIIEGYRCEADGLTSPYHIGRMVEVRIHTVEVVVNPDVEGRGDLTLSEG